MSHSRRSHTPAGLPPPGGWGGPAATSARLHGLTTGKGSRRPLIGGPLTEGVSGGADQSGAWLAVAQQFNAMGGEGFGDALRGLRPDARARLEAADSVGRNTCLTAQIAHAPFENAARRARADS